MSKTLLVIQHTPSPYTQEMFEAVAAGATDAEIEGAEVVRAIRAHGRAGRHA